MSELLGKETIDSFNTSENRGREVSHGLNYQKLGKELYTPDEVRMLDNRYALLFIRGERAVQDEKYDILRHPNIKLTADGGTTSYVHGQAPYAHDLNDILLDGAYEDYEVLSEDEIAQFYKEESEEQNHV